MLRAADVQQGRSANSAGERRGRVVGRFLWSVVCVLVVIVALSVLHLDRRATPPGVNRPTAAPPLSSALRPVSFWETRYLEGWNAGSSNLTGLAGLGASDA
jgi:hypothetical protein